ncbi:MAG: ribose ABC transporter substrate-binding protein RbsB [Firmicutes bacterium]|nr:ribose ABC transporter substrate-binding protein RbsB [Bacillota bacterium]
MKRTALVVLLVLVLGVASVSAQSYVVGLSVSTLNNPFFVDLKEGAEEAAAQLGLTLIATDAQNDANRQLSSVEDLISRGVNILVINPVDSSAIVPAIRAANKGGVPVITVDRGADGGTVVSHVASDNVAGGKMAGEFIVELLGGRGKVVELEGIPGTSAARDRGTGFNAAIASYGDIKVVAKQEAGFDRARGMSVMENILQAQPEINAVFAHNDEMALGALTAIRASGRDIIVVGFDATDDAVKAVEEGRMAATVAQKPREMGKIAVEAALKYLKGEEVPEYVPVDLALVKK